ALPLVQLKAAYVARRRRRWGAADEGGKGLHMPDIVLTRLLREAAHRHVLNHTGTQRADGSVGKIGGHRGFLSRAEGCWTFDARDRMPRSSPATAHHLADS